jgi:hypothetical protein
MCVHTYLFSPLITLSPKKGFEQLWITAASESGIGIGHCIQNVAEIGSTEALKKINEVSLDVDQARLSLTLRWRWSKDAPTKGFPSTEGKSTCLHPVDPGLPRLLTTSLQRT